jgi:hypothetical protein
MQRSTGRSVIVASVAADPASVTRPISLRAADRLRSRSRRPRQCGRPSASSISIFSPGADRADQVAAAASALPIRERISAGGTFIVRNAPDGHHTAQDRVASRRRLIDRLETQRQERELRRGPR